MPDHRTRTVHVPGLVLTEHEIDVPLDHAAPDGAAISFFAREVADVDGRDKPFLVFLQGAPAARRRGRCGCRPAPAGSTGPSRTSGC